ncbi:FtsX-like permease family protein [Hamadaea tsunoensis]|uniref:FtsX-like permease family protein n=1 Tax=Hamadaea tsunoensis TaxID=53368 RepID=UPI0003F7C63E|nr:FtsX-like permease family protein [Hamadaea tsunoensis]
MALALRSLRHRPAAVVTTFLTVLLGTTLTASFGTLVETALGAGHDDSVMLIIIGAVVGGWATLIVGFAVASSVGIVAEQRSHEMGLLRTIGATPGQARALIVFEATMVGLLAACAGALLAAAAGPLLFRTLRGGGLITAATSYGGGPASLAISAALLTLVGLLAAVIASTRATRGPARLALRTAQAPSARLPWWRVIVGSVLVANGVSSAIVTITVFGNSTDPYAAMQTSGSAAVVTGVGLATLAPLLLRMSSAPVRGWLARTPSGYLAALHTMRRSQSLGGMLGPVIVLVSTAVGTLLMVGIDSRTHPAAADSQNLGDTISMINAIVVGMISVFAAIMVVNSVTAAIAYRRSELHGLWRLGAGGGQLRATIALEATVVAAVGILFGLLGSTATAVPYSIVRHEGLVPDGQMWLVPLVAAVAAVLTIGTASATVRRVLLTVAAGGLRRTER